MRENMAGDSAAQQIAAAPMIFFLPEPAAGNTRATAGRYYQIVV
jgi:hypothetical protein